MKRHIITGAGLALALTACNDFPTDLPDPDFALGVDQVAICHIEKETGLWELLMVSPLGKAVEKHLAHGDAFPGDPVPGLAEKKFDATCGIVSAIKIFAIAYSDMNEADGPGFKEGTDVLIAKLIDANGDGELSAGDQVITNKYPTSVNPGLTDFGSFTVTTHTVQEVQQGVGGVLVVVVEGSQWITFWRTISSFDGYFEGTELHHFNITFIVDIFGAGTDTINMDPTSVSEPASLHVEGNRDGTDDPFIDVDINSNGL